MPRRKVEQNANTSSLEMPGSVANDSFKAAKWQEITQGRKFSPSDIPTLTILIYWHQIAQQCMDDIDEVGQVAYQNKLGDLKALPQIDKLKQASAEIRQINKQLGINDSVQPEKKKTKQGKTLQFVMDDRAKKAKRVKSG